MIVRRAAPILFIMTACALNSGAATMVVAPNGSASAAGTVAAPTTLVAALDKAAPGDTILMRGGIYNQSSTIVITRNGTATAMIRVFAYGSEVPVINFSAMAENASNRGVVLDGNYWHWRGIVIELAGDNGMLLSGSNNTIEKCVFRKNRDSGLQLSRYSSSATDISQWPSNNLIVGCESFDNRDSGNENADGFAPKLTCGRGNIFRNCVAHHNIDDGWDMYAKSETGPIGVVLLEGCIAHSNGTLTDGRTSGSGDKNGFKLGSSGIYVNHIVRRCIAFSNGKHGFTDNGNTASIEFTNNTSWNNADYNFHTRDGATHVFKNNVSFAGGHTDRIVGNTSAPNALTATGTTWPYTASAADFVTMTPGPHAAPTSNGFLTLKSTSRLVDAGVTSTGIAYAGRSPDLGAVEYGLITSTAPFALPRERQHALSVRVTPGMVHLGYTLHAAGWVALSIVDARGAVIRSVRAYEGAGERQSAIDVRGIAAGAYYAVVSVHGTRTVAPVYHLSNGRL